MSQQRTRRERDRSDAVVSGDGTLDQQRVYEMADPLLDRWRTGTEFVLFAIGAVVLGVVAGFLSAVVGR